MCERRGLAGCDCAERIRLLEAQLVAKESKLVAKEAESSAKDDLINRLNGQLEQLSELSKANERLEIANAKLKQQSQNMMKHFACMSHEIRTPLNCIVGMASLLLDTPMNQFQQEAVRMITTSGDVLATVVDDVLDFSKIESGDFTLNIQKDVDLQLTLESITASIQMKADQADRGLWIRSYIGTTVPQYLDTDKQRLSQILYNLLGNAVKFSNKSGYVDLKCNIVCVSGQKWIRFQVKDYGKGIAQENYDKIFQPFQQIMDSSGDSQGGTGLGLPITVKLVEKLGGRISVESQVGTWTEFTVELPFHGQEAATFERDALRVAGATVLVVVARPMTDCPVGIWMHKAGFGMDLVPSCEEMEPAVARLEAKTPKDHPHYYIVLMHDECFDKTLYSRFAGNHRCQLVTFGHKLIEEAAVHMQVPCRVFPTLLLPILGGLMDRMKTAKNNRIETTLSTSMVVIRDQVESPRKNLSRTSPAAHNYSNLNILIAEDNVINQKVLLRTLNRLNLHNVDIVDNGRKAVHAAREKDYDLVFMDMEMPVMNGVDACLAINKTKRKVLPVIVFVTAHAMESFRKQASDAGGFGFVTKPFNLEKIQELMESIPWDILRGSEITPLALRKQLGSLSGLPFITN